VRLKGRCKSCTACVFFGEHEMEYKTINSSSQAELIQKKSKFIAFIAPISSENDAVDVLDDIRHKRWDANHHVYAYLLYTQKIQRFSDDGEPQGSSGMPVLDVLQREQLFNCIAVVTRYFGGTLLGIGGLVRAYSGAARLAIEAAKIVTMRLCIEYTFNCEYNLYSAVQKLFFQTECRIVKTDFLDNIDLDILVPETCDIIFLKGLSEITFGKVTPKKVKELFSG
jgi:uncharacterized YigZ family protein